MNVDTFSGFATQYASIFSTGTANAVQSGLSAISGPLTAVVVLWIIIQGIFVMRGDISARSGITKIMRVVLVVTLLSSFSYFSTYVVDLFQTTLPNWAAGAITGTPGANAAPHMFDQCGMAPWPSPRRLMRS
jgi:type IV secretion system protein VirB6